MNIVRTIFLALGAIFALLLVFVGIVGYLITGPAPTCAAGETEVSAEAAASLDRKIEALKRDMDEASVGDMVSLLITEREAASKLDQLAKAGELPVEVSHIQIRFDDGTIGGCALIGFLIDVQVAIQAKMGVDGEGQPETTVERLNLGRLSIPSTLVDQVMIAIMRQLDERWQSIPIELRDITIADGELTVIGEIR